MGAFFATILILLMWIAIYVFFLRKRGKYRAKIIPFIGFGTRDSFQISGRVVVDRGSLVSYAIKELKARKFIRNLRRLRPIKVPNAKLEIHFGFYKEIVTTDEYGYYKLKIVLDDGKLPVGTNRYTVQLIEEGYSAKETFGDIVIIDENVDYGVICDIDDTILQSDVNKKIKLLVNTFVTNERDMEPIPGMNLLLTSLQVGPNKVSHNPILYLTASPFDLIDKISSFLKTNFFPQGPLIMKKRKGKDKDKLFDSYNYKVKKLHEIFKRFPKMNFIMIGDNTERDVEAFNLMDESYPTRVKMILIMNVTEENRDPERYKKALLCGNSLDAGIECLKGGVMSPSCVGEIGEKLKNLDVLPTDYDVDNKINDNLPFPQKEFRKFMKSQKKKRDKREKRLKKLFNKTFSDED